MFGPVATKTTGAVVARGPTLEAAGEARRRRPEGREPSSAFEVSCACCGSDFLVLGFYEKMRLVVCAECGGRVYGFTVKCEAV